MFLAVILFYRSLPPLYLILLLFFCLTLLFSFLVLLFIFFLLLFFSFLLFFLFFFLSLSLYSLPHSNPPFSLLPLPPLLNVFYLNLSCVNSFCFVLLNFTCLQVVVCLLMFLLNKLFFRHIIKHCTTRTRLSDPVGIITGYPDPDGKRHPAVPYHKQT